jgi:hypothetical protein
MIFFCILLNIKVKAKWSLHLIKHHGMKMYGTVQVQHPAFLTSELDQGEWLASCPGRLIWERKYSTQRTGD